MRAEDDAYELDLTRKRPIYSPLSTGFASHFSRWNRTRVPTKGRSRDVEGVGRLTQSISTIAIVLSCVSARSSMTVTDGAVTDSNRSRKRFPFFPTLRCSVEFNRTGRPSVAQCCFPFTPVDEARRAERECDNERKYY